MLLQNRYWLWAMLLFSTLQTALAQFPLSPNAEISVFTIAPGHADDALFTQFGHSAFRVKDPIRRVDWIYDYGVFDFNAPNFYVKFARGKLNYMLAKRDYNRFEAYYQYLNRSLTEQVLDLDSLQKQKVFDYLENNYLPENRFYLYDFFYDNCATRLPDVLKAALGDELIFDESPTEEVWTFRDLIEPRLTQHRWGDLGIDIALGLPTDIVATRYQYMFLPFYVEKEFGKAELKSAAGSRPLVKDTKQVYEAIPASGGSFTPGPGLVFGILLVLVLGITFNDYKNKKVSRFLDFILFFVSGLVGLLIVFLWFFTDHTATANNLNIVWALPTHFVIAFYAVKKTSKNWVPMYFMAFAILVVLLLLLWYFLPQPLHYSMLPFVIALGLRSLYIWYYHKKLSNN